MRVNTSLLVAAVALYTSQCLASSTKDDLDAFNDLLEERGAANSGLYKGGLDSSASSDTLESDDVVQNDDKIVVKSNKKILDQALGSAADGNDLDKFKALSRMSEKDLDNILNSMTPPKGISTGLNTTKSNAPALKPSVPIPASYSNDYSPSWNENSNDDHSGSSDDDPIYTTSPSQKPRSTKYDVADTTQDDTESVTKAPKLDQSKYDTDSVDGDVVGTTAGAGLYAATKGKSGKTVDDSLYPTDDSSVSGDLYDKPLKSNKNAAYDDLDMDGSFDDDVYTAPKSNKYAISNDPTAGSDDDVYTAPKSKKYATSDDPIADSDDDVYTAPKSSKYATSYDPTAGSDDDMYTAPKSSKYATLYDTTAGSDDDVYTAPKSSKYATLYDTTAGSDDDVYTAPKSSKYATSNDPTPGSDDYVYTAPKSNKYATLYDTTAGSDDDVYPAPKSSKYATSYDPSAGSDDDLYTDPKSKKYATSDPIAGSDDGLTYSPNNKGGKDQDLAVQDSDNYGDDGSDFLDPMAYKKPFGSKSPEVESMMKANQEKVKNALGPDALAGGEMGLVKKLGKMDQKELDDLLASFSTTGSLDSLDDGSDAYDSWMQSAEPTKKPKKTYITPPSALDPEADPMEKVDMDGLNKLDDKDLKPPSLSDYLKDYGTPAPSDSDYSDKSDSSEEDDPTTPAPTPSSTPAEEKPCKVDWWRKLAFWKNEHKCKEEQRRLRTDLD